MTRDLIQDILPLTPLQEGILFHTVEAPETGVYVVQLSFSVEGALDTDALRRAWSEVVRRHSILRTAFVWKRTEKPLQVVRERVELPWEELDWRDRDAAREEVDLEHLLAEERRRGFEVGQAPLLRLWIVRCAPREAVPRHRFVWSYHHLLLDGWSTSLVLEELLGLYGQLARGGEPRLPEAPRFGDYVTWLQDRDLAEAEAYWRDALAGVTEPTLIPRGLLAAAPAPDGDRIARVGFQVPRDLTGALRELAAGAGLTLNTVVQGAWALTLGRSIGSRDVVFGTTVSGRPPELPGIDAMVGLFINTLPARVRVPEETPVVEWLREIQRQQAEQRQYEHTPLIDVQRWSGLPAGRPLFDSLLVYENYPVDEAVSRPGGDGGLRFGDVKAAESTHYPLNLTVTPGPFLDLQLEVDRSRLEETTGRRLLARFRTVLAAFAADSGAPVGTISCLGPGDRHQMLAEWNDTGFEEEDATTVQALFRRRARERPDAPAVVALRDPALPGDRPSYLSYGELDRRSDRLARRLAAAGAGPEVRVGLFLHRTPDMIVAVLGILKSGAIYVPLNPVHPDERLAEVVEHCAPLAVVTEPALAARLPAEGPPRLEVSAAPDAPEAPPADASFANGGVILYTSGSTGRPKGVLLEHRVLASHARAVAEEIDLGPDDRGLQFAPLSFDTSAEEICSCFAAGATLVLRREAMIESAEEFFGACREERVTFIDLPTAYWHELAVDLPAVRTSDVRVVLIGGERVLPEPARRWGEWGADRGRGRARVINTYGPAEGTIAASFGELGREDGAVTIGPPIARRRLYVVDGRLRETPPGAPGELCIAGSIARGYYGRPGLTAERFVPDPFGRPGARLYRTGDLARWLSDGLLDYVGRIDHQVKILGTRVEPGEVEAVLGTHPDVGETAVIPRELPAGLRLVAYVVPRGGVRPSATDLRAFVRRHLPEPMVPAAYVLLDELPLTPNDKVDRRALRPPAEGELGAADGYEPPRDALERKLVQIWEEILGVRPVGIRTGFFDLGGHSLLAIRLIAQVRKRLDAELSLGALATADTVELQARALRAREPGGEESPLVPLEPTGEGPPFFFVHPIGGDVLCYRALAGHLAPEHPSFGLRAPDLSELAGREPASIEEKAAAYVDAVLAERPVGPYLLCGWSYGGVVAFEMARQMEERGLEVGLLALLDTWSPDALRAFSTVDEATFLAALATEQAELQGSSWRASADDVRSLDPAVRLERLHREMVDAGLLAPEIDLEWLERYVAGYRARDRALDDYRPPAYPGPITVVRAAEMEPETEETLRALGLDVDDPTCGWSALTPRPVACHPAPGTHAKLVHDPAAGRIAEILRRTVASSLMEEAR